MDLLNVYNKMLRYFILFTPAADNWCINIVIIYSLLIRRDTNDVSFIKTNKQVAVRNYWNETLLEYP